MIDYPTFHRLRQLRDEEHLSVAQIAQALALDERTVGKWIAVEKYQPRKIAKRPGKLDPFKRTIVRLLAQHPYTAQQLLQRLKEGGYTGGYSILKEFVHQVRPAAAPAFLTLHFAPGQSRPRWIGVTPACWPWATRTLKSPSTLRSCWPSADRHASNST